VLPTLAVMVFCLHAPFTWVVLIDYSWSSYRWSWVRLWPVLPGLLPASVLHRAPDWIGLTVMGLVTAGLLALTTWIGRRGPATLRITAAVVLALSIANASIAYVLYRM
jgi:hypothetical protein